MNPEIAYQEFNTTNLILKSVGSAGGSKLLKIHQPLKTGVLFEYKVNDGPFILFRADIDALPIKEENVIDFRSTNNYMHACGHDVHTSILFAFLKDILEIKPDRNLLFLFQPAEESGGGAMKFYDTGIFDDFKIKHAFALHVTDEYPLGSIASTPGVLFASALEVDIEFIGENAHVAFPAEGRNAFNALRIFLDSADKMLRDPAEPFIFGIGRIKSGFVRNIAPGTAKLEGSVRGLSRDKVLNFLERIKEILEEVKRITGVNYQVITGAHYPEVVVDRQLYSQLSDHFKKNFNFIDCGYKMTGEDFGFFSKKYPSFMFWLGTSEGERFGLHNPRFLPPDTAIETGKKAFLEIFEKVTG
jgi:N-acetyldiaminopimelate deacetylase